jgi:glycosyltransferase involved in cell wall biosynthesis
MAKALVAAGHQVTMVCGSYQAGDTGLVSPFIKGKRTGCVNGINIIEFELEYANQQNFIQRSLAFAKFAWRSIAVAMTHKYDLIFATTTPLTAAIPGIVGKWLKRKPFVFEVRDLWPELPKEMGVITNPLILFMLGRLEWLAYKSADQHIGLSPGIKLGIERLLSNKFKQASPVAMIPNGCDLDIFAQTTESWQPDGIQQDDFVAVFTGTHGIANDLDQVISAAIELKRIDQTKIKIVLIGQGKLKPALVARAKENNLDNIVFLAPVNKKQLAKLMRRANVGLQVLANVPAFYYGTSPNKFFDYLSAGLPIINNYPGWVAELIEKHHCGLAVKPNCPADFAQALITLSNSPKLCEQMSKNSIELAQKEFARENLAKQFVEQLEKVGQ